MATTGAGFNKTKGVTQTGRLTYENTEKYVKVGGINLHYHEAGEEHPNTIVFLHGGGLGASGWFNFYLNFEPFAEHFRTILLDSPNYGKSDSVDLDKKPPDSDILSEFLKAKGIEKATPMGNSKGGSDAIRFSVEHTDQLDLLILMGAATGPSLFDPMPHHGSAVLKQVFHEPTREKIEEALHLMVYDDSVVTDEFIDMRFKAVQAAEAHRQKHARAADWFQFQRLSSSNFTGELHKVPNPTLVIFGAHDRFAALDSSVSLMRHYPDSELHIWRNCGHWVQWEVADEFNELVINWMLKEKRKEKEAGA